jgi:amino acid adenylation domain-containing protein
MLQNPEHPNSPNPARDRGAKRHLVMDCDRIQDYKGGECLHQLVEEQVDRAPDAIALTQGTAEMSYGELNRRANQLAAYLRDNGVKSGERVAVCLYPSFDFAVAILAVLKSGAAVVPLDPRYPRERLSYMLNDVAAPAAITAKALLPSALPAGCNPIFLSEISDELTRRPVCNLRLEVKPDDIAYVIYTSGSTGRPRGVLLKHLGLTHYNVNIGGIYGMTPGDRFLQFCSISFDASLEEIFTTWLHGATLVLKQPETPLAVPDFLKWVEEQRVTVLDLPTAYWHEWVHYLPELQEPLPRDLRLVIVGGEKALGRSYAQWLSSIGNRVRWVNSYGPTEATVAATLFEPQYRAGDAIPDAVPIGRPLPEIQIHLLDPSLQPVPAGVAGELHVGGVGVAQGYLNHPELTAQKFIPDPFSGISGARLYKTGDMARYSPSGEIEFLGRVDHQIKIRGFRIELGEIESFLARHPGVREVAVIAREDTPGDKRLIAYIVAVGREIETAQIRRYLQERLPDYMVPAEFVTLEAMPLTPNGKIDRRGLPEPKPTPAIEKAQTSDPLEAQLVDIWQEVLRRKPIEVRDNFFELGGHSLLAARLMHRTGQVLGKPLPLALLFESPTIQQMAASLRRDGWSHHWSSLVPIQASGSRPPFFCVHGVGGNVLGFRELAARMAPDYPFYGLQSYGLDGTNPCHGRVEDMAAHYLREIRVVQASGPYHIGGFSFGGLVAYEMARQLREQGQEAGLVVLFDTYPGNVANGSASSLAKNMMGSPLDLLQRLPRAVWKRLRRNFRAWGVPELLVRVRDSNKSAADHYVLRPYPEKVTLIRAREKSLRISDDPHAAWNNLAGHLEIQEIPGDHYDILVPPQVDRLAECLKDCIDRAGRGNETTPSGSVTQNLSEMAGIES